MRKRPDSAEWPVVLESFAASGEPARALTAPSDGWAAYYARAMRVKCHAAEMDVTVIKRGRVVYLLNDAVLGVRRDES